MPKPEMKAASSDIAARAGKLTESCNEMWRAARDLDEALRELLSYFTDQAEQFDPDNISDEFNPYDDAAYKLRAILDGE